MAPLHSRSGFATSPRFREWLPRRRIRKRAPRQRRPERRTEQFQPVLLENRDQFVEVGGCAAWSRRFQFLEEDVQAARNHGRQCPAGNVAGVLKCMPAAAWREHRVPRPRPQLPSIHDEPEFAFQNVPPLVLIAMAVQRRTFQRGRPSLEDRECADRIGGGYLDRDLGAEYVNIPAGAAPGDQRR